MNTFKLIIWPIVKITIFPVFVLGYLFVGISRGFGIIANKMDYFFDDFWHQISAKLNPKIYQIYQEAIEESKKWKPRYEAERELCDFYRQEVQDLKDKYQPDPNLNGYKVRKFNEAEEQS